MRACCVRQLDLEELWCDRRTKRYSDRKLLNKFDGYGLLVLDEWLLNKPGDLFGAMPLELMELRYGSSSTVFCTQYRSKDRHARLGDKVHAEAIMDRIVRGTVWLEMGTSTCATYTADGTIPQYSRYGNAQIPS